MRQKQTKIIATISDRDCTKEFISNLYSNGMDIVRLNTAHQMPEDSKKVIDIVRSVSDKIGILIDTKGPEIRTRVVKEDDIFLKNGAKVVMKYGSEKDKSDAKTIYVSHKKFAKETPNGAAILIDDGAMELKCMKKTGDSLICKVVNGGQVKSRKSVNVPEGHFSVEALTKKDKLFVKFAIEEDVDFIAHSFVRNAKDVIGIQKILDKAKSKVKLVAKIENQEGVDNLEEILPHVYGVMVARGDLAIETSAERIPVIQKRMIETCVRWGKPVITATQMLESMIDNPRPTRAEVSDVANAILDGTSAIMLSGETAYGKHPVKAVAMMSCIAKDVETHKEPFRENYDLIWSNPIHRFFGEKAIEACAELPIKAIFASTRSGANARLLSSFRGNVPIFAETNSKKVARELAMVYGVHPSYVPRASSMEQQTKLTPEMIKAAGLKKSDLVLFVGSAPGSNLVGANYIEVKKVSDCM